MRYLLLFLLLASFAACKSTCSEKQVSCPAFDDNVSLLWFPYKVGDKLVFRSPDHADTVTIVTRDLSASYNTTTGGWGSSGGCKPTADISSDYGTFDQSKGPSIQVHLDGNSGGINMSGGYVNIRGSGFGIQFNAQQKLDSGAYSNVHFYNQKTLDQQTFIQVEEIYIDTLKQSLNDGTVYMMWLAKNKGVVGYQEFHGKLWVKQ